MTLRESDLEQVFLEAARRAPADRDAYLSESCGEDEDLRQQVEVLLQAHDNAGSFLEHPPTRAFCEDVADAALLAELNHSFDPSDEPGHLGRLDHYEILAVIGRGGMGVVYRGLDTRLNRIVAIKFMASSLSSNAMSRHRFLREAQAAAAINHNHVVTIHGVDERNHVPYIVMECIVGQSLQDRLNDSSPLRIEEILRIGKQIALGLGAAHAEGLIHRDIKPANVLLENGIERVKITDFGLARAVDDVGITQTGAVAGTPQFMSPEQAEGSRIDHRTDLFSLGSVLYAMCTGRPPFRATSTVGVLKRVCHDTPRPIRDVNSSIPRSVIRIIDRLLAKRPEHRVQTAKEAARLLGRELSLIQNGASDEMATAASKPVPNSRRRWLWTAAALLVAVAGLGLSEASGVTQLKSFVGSVLHIETENGTLVVEVDDPRVGVTVTGDGTTITGAGPQELKLKPGRYLVQGAGRREWVQIERDGHQVVRIRWEPKHPDATTPGSMRKSELPEGGPRPSRTARRSERIQDPYVQDLQMLALRQFQRANSPPPPPPKVNPSRYEALTSREILTSPDWTWTPPARLGPQINTPRVENGPCLSDNGLTLYFASSRRWPRMHDLWVAKRKSISDPWDTPVPLGRALIGDWPDYSPEVSTDGLTLIFNSKFRPGGRGGHDLWISKRSNVQDVWGVPKPLREPINTTFDETNATLSHDGRTLIFASTRPGGLGNNDLWMCQRSDADASWSEPKHLGGTINTSHWEVHPELASDGLSLLFISGRDGGGARLWLTTRTSLDSPWESPQQVEPIIRGGGSLSADNRMFVFSYYEDSDNSDLWVTYRVPRTLERP